MTRMLFQLACYCWLLRSSWWKANVDCEALCISYVMTWWFGVVNGNDGDNNEKVERNTIPRISHNLNRKCLMKIKLGWIWGKLTANQIFRNFHRLLLGFWLQFPFGFSTRKPHFRGEHGRGGCGTIMCERLDLWTWFLPPWFIRWWRSRSHGCCTQYAATQTSFNEIISHGFFGWLCFLSLIVASRKSHSLMLQSFALNWFGRFFAF